MSDKKKEKEKKSETATPKAQRVLIYPKGWRQRKVPREYQG